MHTFCIHTNCTKMYMCKISKKMYMEHIKTSEPGRGGRASDDGPTA